MKLSIILVNYKTAKLTEQCVRGILNHPPDCVYEILVVDNNSADDCCERINALADTTTVPLRCIASSKNLGFSAGNNIGVREAKGQYILFLNPDTVIFDASIQPLIDYLDAHEDVAVVGPKILNPDKTIQLSCFRFPDTLLYPLYRRTGIASTTHGKAWLDWFSMKSFDRNTTKDVDWLLGASMMVRRSAIDEVGMFDERFFLFLEDTDWCYRFWLAGWRVVYHPAAWLVHHIERASDEKSVVKSLRKKTAWIHIISWLKYYKKHLWRNERYPRRRV